MARRPKFRHDSVICVNLNLTKNSKLPRFLRCGSAFFLAPPRLCLKWWKTSNAMCLRKRHIDLGGSRQISWCLSGGAGRGGASQEFPHTTTTGTTIHRMTLHSSHKCSCTIPNTPLVLFLSNLTPKMPMLQDPYVNQTTTLQNITVMLILPLPQFHKISSVSTHLFAKPPMAFQVNTEASEVVVL